jgi:hypothetical protein
MKSSPKVSRAGRELIRARILAGDTNDQIRAKLIASGDNYPTANSSFAHYRQDPEILAAIAERQANLKQIGLGDRTRRFLKLNGVGERLERRLMVQGGFDDPDSIDSLSGKGLFHLDRYLATLEQIRKEVGDDKQTVEHQVGENSLTLLRDILGVQKPDGK